MIISRRQFMKYCTVAAGAIGLTTTDLLKLEKAFAKETSPFNVAWIAGQACTGCTVSLANSVYYSTIQDLLLFNDDAHALDLNYIETLMAGTGSLATGYADITQAPFILAIEGAIPTADAGAFCEIGMLPGGPTMTGVVTALANHANCAAILAIGTCASFGGLPAAAGSVTGAKGALSFLGSTFRKKIVNIPGCPPNPNWIVGTIAYILANFDGSVNLPNVDNLRRPSTYYDQRICNNCDRFIANKDNFVGAPTTMAVTVPGQLGDPNINKPSGYCLKKAGCKGSRTKSDCSWRKWHSPGALVGGVNWCVGAGAPCQGCTQINWPDRFSPFTYLR